MELRLDENHRYWLGSERLIGVSDVMRDNRLVDPQWFTEESRSRGRAVHAGIYLASAGRLDWSTLHPDLHGWVKSGLRLIDAYKLKVISAETPRWHPIWLYAGTKDVSFEFQGGEVIGDYKSGEVPKTTKHQLWAYDMLEPERKARKHWGIKLHEDGAIATITEFDFDRYAGEKFLSLLSATRERIEHRKSDLDF